MSRKNDSDGILDDLFSYLRLGIVGAGVIGFLTLGPIDLARTAYNSLVGDVPLIRERGVRYVRQSLKRENPDLKDSEIESKLAKALDYNLTSGEKVNPQDVRMMELWDATESYASGYLHQWIWPSLPKK